MDFIKFWKRDFGFRIWIFALFILGEKLNANIHIRAMAKPFVLFLENFIETDWCFSCKYPWFWRHNYASPKCQFVLESSIWIDIFTGTQICIRILCKLIITWFNWSALDTGSDEGDTVATEGSSRSQHLAMRSNQGLNTIGDCTPSFPLRLSFWMTCTPLPHKGCRHLEWNVVMLHACATRRFGFGPVTIWGLGSGINSKTK